jgi:SAM-dependent methyltransferase
MSGPVIGAHPVVALPRENVYGHSRKARLVLEALARLREDRAQVLDVLDVGCGNGSALTRFLAARGDRVLGIDTHAPSIEYAKRQFGMAGLAFRQVDCEALLAEARRFDAVICADVLEHLLRPEAALSCVERLLRPGGRFIVTIPNGFGPFELESWLSRLPVVGTASLWVVDHLTAVLNRFVFRGAWTAVVTPPDLPYNAECGHVQFFTRGALLRMAARCGLTMLRQTGVSWLSGPYTNYLFAPSRLFCHANAQAGQWLPSWMLSAWFFEFGRTAEVPSSVRGPGLR